MPWARASALHRHLVCPSASWLQRWDDRTLKAVRPYMGRQTDHGVLNPSFMEPRDKRAADTGLVAHERKERGEAYTSLYRGVNLDGHHEAAVAYCCKTGRSRVVVGLDQRRRDIWKSMQCEHSVVGTADWLGWLDGHRWVDDLKTGWRVPEVLTAQTLFYAMVWKDAITWTMWQDGSAVLHKHTGPETDPVAVTVTHDPRAKGDNVRRLFRWASPIALEAFRVDLHEAWRVTTLDRRPRPGEHCSYCPSAAWCPAATS